MVKITEITKGNGRDNPRNWGVPHDSWRPHQFETVEWAQNVESFGVLEAPTGSGKSAIATAISHVRPVLVLTKTKNLQNQYAELYGAAVLYGRANYPCVIYPNVSAEDCDRKVCYEKCSYRTALLMARNSPFTALNYALALSSSWLQQDDRPYVFLDEAHELSDITLEWVGCTVYERDVVEFDLPPFPEIHHSGANVLLRLENPVDIALPWLRRVVALTKRYKPTPNMSKSELAHHRRGYRLHNKIENVIRALEQDTTAWFIRSGTGVMGGKGFVARPLTARFHFPTLFRTSGTRIAMSATIGNVGAFAEELGVSDYQARSVPSAFTPEERRVYVLDAPGMGRRSTESDRQRQADVIAGVLKEFPEWSGLVLVTRKSEASFLAERLARRGLQDRVWVTPGADGQYAPTDEQSQAWHARRRAVPNSVCVTWAFWEGYDGVDERICIAAKVPFPYLGDEYERERFEFSKKFFLQRTAWTLEQGLGRTRRSEEDYGEGNGFVAIADGDWVRVKGNLSRGLRDAIARW